MNERRKLSNDELVRHLDDGVSRERGMTLEVLYDLNEMARRRLHLDRGYSSLFDYCVRKLKYSSSAAARRIQAARCIRRYPVVLRMLERGEVNLSTVSSIASILNPQNCETILRRVRGASCRQVERIACEYRPPVALRDRVQPVQVNVTPGAGSEHRLFVQFLADQELMDLLDEVKSLLGRTGKKVSIADVVKATLKEYRDRHSPAARQERREARNGAASLDSRRRESNNAPSARHIPDEVRDDVFVRDHGRCSFVAKDGTLCESSNRLQIDHIRPFAAGGTHDPSNLRLLCAAHNRRAAELRLGAHVMQRYWRPA